MPGSNKRHDLVKLFKPQKSYKFVLFCKGTEKAVKHKPRQASFPQIGRVWTLVCHVIFPPTSCWACATRDAGERAAHTLLQLHLWEYHFSSFSLHTQRLLKSLRRMSANRRFYIGKSKQFPFIAEINWSKRTFIAPVQNTSSQICFYICF